MTLEQQIRAAYPGENWDQGGVNRAAELAQLLGLRGITDLSQLQGTRQAAQGFAPHNTGDEGYIAAGSPTPAAFNIGGKNGPIGFLGNVNQDGSVDTSVAQDFFNENNTLGWSSQGHGNVSYDAQFDPQGNFSGIAPRWESSNSWQEVRPFLQMAAMYAGGQLLGGGADPTTAATGVNATAADLALPAASNTGIGIEGLGTTAAGTGAGAEGLFGTGIEFGAGTGAATPSITGSSLLTGAAGGGGGAGAYSALEPLGYVGQAAPIADVITPTAMQTGSAGWLDGVPWKQVAGAALGYANSKDQQASSSKDPWQPAQGWLKDLIGQGQTIGADLLANPFSDTQKGAHNNLFAVLNAANQAAPGWLASMQSNASGGQAYDRTNPRGRKAVAGSAPSLNLAALMPFGG